MKTRRDFLQTLALTAGAASPFIQSLQAANGQAKKRMIILFTPNGTIPEEFWPTTGENGEMQLGRILKPLEPWKQQMLALRGVWNKVEGDGDRHMRGMSCLLTGTELMPGNIQGGSDTPAGWAGGISIDQELKNFLQANEATKTRFGSLELGVAIPNRADPWTRMSYLGANQPVAPVDDPEQLFGRLYGQTKDKDSIVSVLDGVKTDLANVTKKLGNEDRALLEEHLQLVREFEQELQNEDKKQGLTHPMPDIDPDIEIVNDNTPEISRIQIDMLVNSMANDMTRIATLQYMRSVGQARMNWLGIPEGHHGLSHEPDGNQEAKEKLIKINHWFAGEVAHLVKRLADTPEPGVAGDTMLDHTTVVWLNELGKGNSHTLQNIPFLMVGGQKSTGFKMGRTLDFDKAAHNRLWMTMGDTFGHHMDHFGLKELSEGGALDLAS